MIETPYTAPSYIKEKAESERTPEEQAMLDREKKEWDAFRETMEWVEKARKQGIRICV